ncbi:membrane protein [Kitasatospora griseola]|nr:membrane protein [Kitasatospora griseola]
MPVNAPPAPVAGSAPRRLVRPLVALVSVAMPTAFVAAVDPNTPGHYPVCPVLQATGWWCPGCGGLRCVHALTRGDLLTAGHDNLLVTLLALTALVLWVRWAVRAVRGRPAGFRLTGRQAVLLMLVLALFAVVRNLPIGAGLAPPAV